MSGSPPATATSPTTTASPRASTSALAVTTAPLVVPKAPAIAPLSPPDLALEVADLVRSVTAIQLYLAVMPPLAAWAPPSAAVASLPPTFPSGIPGYGTAALPLLAASASALSLQGVATASVPIHKLRMPRSPSLIPLYVLSPVTAPAFTMALTQPATVAFGPTAATTSAVAHVGGPRHRPDRISYSGVDGSLPYGGTPTPARGAPIYGVPTSAQGAPTSGTPTSAQGSPTYVQGAPTYGAPTSAQGSLPTSRAPRPTAPRPLTRAPRPPTRAPPPARRPIRVALTDPRPQA